MGTISRAYWTLVVSQVELLSLSSLVLEHPTKDMIKAPIIRTITQGKKLLII
jgi:hypothetical protein